VTHSWSGCILFFIRNLKCVVVAVTFFFFLSVSLWPLSRALCRARASFFPFSARALAASAVCSLSCHAFPTLDLIHQLCHRSIAAGSPCVALLQSGGLGRSSTLRPLRGEEQSLKCRLVILPNVLPFPLLFPPDPEESLLSSVCIRLSCLSRSCWLAAAWARLVWHVSRLATLRWRVVWQVDVCNGLVPVP
jgi:hypothetical protein